MPLQSVGAQCALLNAHFPSLSSISRLSAKLRLSTLRHTQTIGSTAEAVDPNVENVRIAQQMVPAAMHFLTSDWVAEKEREREHLSDNRKHYGNTVFSSKDNSWQ